MSFKRPSRSLACLIVLWAGSLVAQAQTWQFGPAVELAAEQPGVFHHLESSGRQHIAVAKNIVAVVWEDNRSGTPSIYLASSKRGSRFTDPIPVSGGGEAYDPVVLAYDGGFLLGWEEAGAVWIRSYASGVLGKPRQLSDKPAGQISLAVGNRSELLAVWSEQHNKHRRIRFAGLSEKESNWTQQRTAEVDPKPGNGDQSFPVVAYHATLSAYIVGWQDRRYQNVMLFSAIGTLKNGFSVAMQVNELLPPFSAKYGVATGVARPAIAPYKDQIALTWADKRNFRFGYDIYMAFATGSGRFGENQIVQDGFAEGFEQWHPSIAGRGGHLVIAWDDDRDGSADIWYSVYQDQAWSDDLALGPASGDGEQAHPSLTMDDQGNLHAVWIHRAKPGGATSLRYSMGRIAIKGASINPLSLRVSA